MFFSEFWYKYLFLLGIAVVIYARSLKSPAVVPMYQSPLIQNLRYGSAAQVRLNPFKIAISVFVALCTILLLIWLLSRVSPDFLRILYALCVGTILALLTLSSGVFDRHESRGVRLGIVLLSGIVFGLLAPSWIMAPVWIVYDILAILLGYIILSQLGQIRLRYVTALLLAIALYDLWGVWGSSVIVGGSGMIGGVALEMSWAPPGLVMVPANVLMPLGSVIGRLGVGDIVVPGIAILSASYFHLEKEAIAGFALGLLATFVLAIIVQRPLPATITLNPFVLFGVVAGARWRGIKLEW